MFEYDALLRILTKKPVLPFALFLRSGLSGLEWNSYAETVFDHNLVKFEYGQVGLRDLKSVDYLATNEPVAATLSALMQPDGLSTAELKLHVLEVLVKSSLTEADKNSPQFISDLIATIITDPRRNHEKTSDSNAKPLAGTGVGQLCTTGSRTLSRHR